MIKKIWFLLTLVSCAAAFHAQSFQGGILFGITGSQVDGDSYAGYNKPGFQGGVFIHRDLTPHLAIGLEIKYTGRGARNPASDDNTGFYKLSLHYIDIPVYGAIHIHDLVALDIGLIPGYLFTAKGEDDAGSLPEEYLVDFNKFDLGTLIGISINITPKLAFCLRHSYSLLSIRDLESAGAYYSWFGKLFGHVSGDFNNYLSLSFHYRLQ